MDEVVNDLLWIMSLWIRATAGLTALALLLSLAGIYAVSRSPSRVERARSACASRLARARGAS